MFRRGDGLARHQFDRQACFGCRGLPIEKGEQMPHRQFAVLVAGPMFRVKERSEQLARAIAGQIEKHAKPLHAAAAA